MNPLMEAMRMTQNNSKIGNLTNIVSMLKGGNPEQIAQIMMQKNPQFKAFIEANKGKTPDQVAREHGIDFSQFMRQFK